MDDIKYGDERRKWHPEFVRYMNMIVTSPQFRGMPWAIDDQHQIRWNAPSNRPPGGKWSDLHDERLDWWRKKAKEVGIKEEGHWISEVAKKIHPTGSKPCQTCGRIMQLQYVYPTKLAIKQINSYLSEDEKLDYFEFKTIYEICDYLFDAEPNKASKALHDLFPKIPANIADKAGIKKVISEEVVPSETKGKLSPGAMSNAPDRLDGFHTYNLCCRSKQDTGRDSANLRTYTDDRRAFEQWCEGNWAAANLLMKMSGIKSKCNRCGHVANITADHVGPISLGFAHTPFFAPMCRACNSGKNNRMSLMDIHSLLELEKQGVQIVSWQAKELWDRCKIKVKTEQQALLLSKLLRINQHHYLGLLHLMIIKNVPNVLLQFLNPGYVKYKYEFIDLDPQTFKFSKIVQTPRSETYVKSKSARMTRIAFEALLDYGRKEKRNIQTVEFTGAESVLTKLNQEIEKASKKDSALRKSLNHAMSIEDTTARIEALEEIFRNKLTSDYDFSDVKKSMKQFLSALANVLEQRFDEGRAISRGDLILDKDID